MDDEFRELFKFFAAWFPDADLEGLSDEQVVEKYLATVTPEERSRVTQQCTMLLAKPLLPLDLIAEQAWRKFSTQEDCRMWLKHIENKLRNF